MEQARWEMCERALAAQSVQRRGCSVILSPHQLLELLFEEVKPAAEGRPLFAGETGSAHNRRLLLERTEAGLNIRTLGGGQDRYGRCIVFDALGHHLKLRLEAPFDLHDPHNQPQQRDERDSGKVGLG